jgi:hypothetical protein
LLALVLQQLFQTSCSQVTGGVTGAGGAGTIQADRLATKYAAYLGFLNTRRQAYLVAF